MKVVLCLVIFHLEGLRKYDLQKRSACVFAELLSFIVRTDSELFTISMLCFEKIRLKIINDRKDDFLSSLNWVFHFVKKLCYKKKKILSFDHINLMILYV